MHKVSRLPTILHLTPLWLCNMQVGNWCDLPDSNCIRFDHCMHTVTTNSIPNQTHRVKRTMNSHLEYPLLGLPLLILHVLVGSLTTPHWFVDRTYNLSDVKWTRNRCFRCTPPNACSLPSWWFRFFVSMYFREIRRRSRERIVVSWEDL